MNQMNFIERGTQAYISSSNLSHNLAQFKKLHPGNIIAVVKADAYGHGLSRTVPHLEDCDGFAVATIEEAIELRAINQEKRIILLEGVFNVTELETAYQQHFDVVIHQEFQLKLIQQLNVKNLTLDVWLKIDTGMSRLGFNTDQVEYAIQSMRRIDSVAKIRLMSHFASSDDCNAKQTQKQLALNEWIKTFDLEYSFSNTAAVLNQLSDDNEWVRVGIGLYGISSLQDRWGSTFGLKPVMQLQANIIAIKTISKGSCVGYGGTFIANKNMRIGIVGIGYADGYPWTKNQSHVMIGQRKTRIVGRISMDMLAIDLTELPEVTAGEAVELWGQNWPPEAVAKEMKVIPYTLTCGLTKRVKFYDIQ